MERPGDPAQTDGNATTPTTQPPDFKPPDVAVRALNGWRKGIPGTSNKEDFETLAGRNVVRILKRTAGLLESTEKKAHKWTENKTLQ